MNLSTSPETDRLRDAGLPQGDIDAWSAACGECTRDYGSDCRTFSELWRRGAELLARLPEKARRGPVERAAADTLLKVGRGARERFLSTHLPVIYDALTDNRSRFLRLRELVADAATLVPGLVPGMAELAAEGAKRQADKEGVEIDQGIFIAHTLADESRGSHLCHAMLLPLGGVEDLRAAFSQSGSADLGPVRIARRGNVVHLEALNPRFLNAEDASTLEAMEQAVDVAILDAGSEIAVLRGGRVDHPKYRDKRVFGAGVNLTRLYHGGIPFLWFIERDMGYVHKLLRGVATPESVPDDVHGHGIEKPWIAAVDAFAIGGHCQVLLAVDYVLAASDAFLTLPARKEGIVPGLANLRLPRFIGDRIARQAIQYERRLPCDSPEGRLICDEVLPSSDMDAAVERVAEGLTTAGSVSAVANRRAFRVGQEPLDLFRRYCSVYARDQAYALFSPALIANLERNWDAARRVP
jgi:thioesterase DpgC